MIKDYIKENLIFIKESVSNRQALFEIASDKFYKEGYVTGEFKTYLSDREDHYPTGLALDGYAVAIPHGNPDQVKASFVSVITLEQPIDMYKMDNPEEKVPVSLLFVLGLNDGNKHLTLLKEVIQLIQNKDFVEQLIQAQSKAEIIQLINQESIRA